MKRHAQDKRKSRSLASGAIDPKSRAEWNARLKALGLPSEPRPMRKERRAEPKLDEKGNELELAAALNLDGSALVGPMETELLPAVTRGAWLDLAAYLRLEGAARTVLGMRLLVGCDRESVRRYFLRENPELTREAMSAWREFTKRMPEIRAFLAGRRRDREILVKPHYPLSE